MTFYRLTSDSGDDEDGDGDGGHYYALSASYNFESFGSARVVYDSENQLSYYLRSNRTFSFPAKWRHPFKFRLSLGHDSDGTYIGLTSRKEIYRDKNHALSFAGGLDHDIVTDSDDSGSLSYNHSLVYSGQYEFDHALSLYNSAYLDEEQLSFNSTLRKQIRNNTILLQSTVENDFSEGVSFLWDASLSRDDAFIKDYPNI